jgi:hypothetical protein
MSSSSAPDIPPSGTVERHRASTVASQATSAGVTASKAVPVPDVAATSFSAAAGDGVPRQFPEPKFQSKWWQRNTAWMKNHRKSTLAMFGCCLAANMCYERYVYHGNLVPSPYVDNQLLYRMDVDQGAYRDKARRTLAETVGDAQPLIRTPDLDATKPINLDQEHAAALREKAKQDHAGSRLIVSSAQLAEREGYWKIRINERNWSLLSRDMQRQQDEYDYRCERSRDNDFERHTGR